ncbi:Gfo/Idh/MocA family protein [Microbaculum marinum]|uniref:Gfo/Idh/MocA family oxidoreductase n=1 Tax=Microbaculum marinum TaxID=1764581 RepID=A0AAW9RSU5_9HYPH
MLKIGIIGTGVIAHEHAAAIGMIPGLELVGASDISAGRLTAFADAFGLSRRYEGADELIADSDLQLVVVATPPSTHEALTVAALEAGKSVLCEKPLAHNLESASRIAAAAARHPGRLSIGYQLRYAPQYRRMLWLIRNGWIGEVTEAVVERHGYIPHALAEASWWGRWDIAGGGVLMTQMIHEIDLMIEAMGAPRSVDAKFDTRYTKIESEDWFEVEVAFSGDRRARCAGSVNSGRMGGRFVIKGDKGWISPSEISLHDPSMNRQAQRAVDAALSDTRVQTRSMPARAYRKARRTLGLSEPAAVTPHALLYSDIAAAIAADKPLPIPPSEALGSLEFCAATYESGLRGEPVRLPLAPDAGGYPEVTRTTYAAKRTRFPEAPPARPVPKRNGAVRIGLIGLDTTHAVTFTDLLHNPYNPDHIPGARVVAAFPGGSPDMEVSASRVDGFTSELRDRYDIAIVETPEDVVDEAEIVFILSCDGRTHAGLFRAVAGRGRPVFIDKPLATSLADAEKIQFLARETGTRVFGASAFRYADRLVAALNDIRASGEAIETCTIRYWGQIQPTQGRYFWYGVHGAEMLNAVMGTGLSSVQARMDGQCDVIEVEHSDGRRSTLLGSHVDGTFHVQIRTDHRVLEIPIGGPVSARMLAVVLDLLTPRGYPQLWRASTAGSVCARPSRSIDPGEADTLDVIRLLDGAQKSYASGKRVTF